MEETGNGSHRRVSRWIECQNNTCDSTIQRARTGTVDMINGDETTTIIRAKAVNPTILFQFPGMKVGGVPGVANLKRKTISFEDGNVWTKV
mmetsp:Transcript_31756/g.66798  ORF Transcript_31756/g.66798 Transcript_31756/m.66798 type:complete len:91 (+) Transcript_31756:36-308(+)